MYKVGRRENCKKNFEKGALFYEVTHKWQKNTNIALLSQGRLSMIVGGKQKEALRENDHIPF